MGYKFIYSKIIYQHSLLHTTVIIGKWFYNGYLSQLVEHYGQTVYLLLVLLNNDEPSYNYLKTLNVVA